MAHNVTIKKGDIVRVIAGSDKGAEGKVMQVDTARRRVYVEGINRVKWALRHASPRLVQLRTVAPDNPHVWDEPRFREAVDELWPYALAVVPEDLRPALSQRLDLPSDTSSLGERGEHSNELRSLWEEMTMVRRSEPAGVAW